MRLVRAPRLRIWSLLVLIAAVGIVLAFIRPTPRGKLRIAKLRHGGGWNVAPQAIPKQGR